MPTHVRLRLVGLVALVAGLIVLAAVIDVPSVGQLRHDYAGTGLLGALAFALLYAALTLLPIPTTVYTIAAGAVFGLARGGAIAWTGATIGAVAAFFLGRLLGRDAVTHLTGSRLSSLDAFLDRRGFSAILVARLIPVVPYSAFNYFSGLTRLRPAQYGLATAIGIVPSIVVYSSLGAYGSRPGSWPFLAALGAFAILVGVGLVASYRRGRAGSSSASAESGDTGES